MDRSVVLSMGEETTRLMRDRYSIELYDARSSSFGENFHAIMDDSMKTGVGYLLLIDGDIYPLLPPKAILTISKLLINTFFFDYISYGRIERFSSSAIVAHGGIRVYKIKDRCVGDFRFSDTAKRPETWFVENNKVSGIKLRIPLALHEFYLRPSEARARAIQRRGKSKNIKSLNFFRINGSDTEKAYIEGLNEGINDGNTQYATDLSEKYETYDGWLFILKYIFRRIVRK